MSKEPLKNKECKSDLFYNIKATIIIYIKFKKRPDSKLLLSERFFFAIKLWPSEIFGHMRGTNCSFSPLQNP